jgi:hypothetical protein
MSAILSHTGSSLELPLRSDSALAFILSYYISDRILQK